MILEIIDGEIIAQKLADLPKALAKQIVRGSLLEGISPMVPAMRALIHSRTGLLAGNLKVRIGKGDRAGRTSIYVSSFTSRARFERVRKVKTGVGKAKDRYSVFYGGFVEFGHRIAGGGEVEPHSFLRDIYDAQAEAAGTKIENALGESVEEAFLS
jgi:hypothetical protein